jgi:hypothetical protein
MANVYYGSLIRWESIDEIVLQTDPDEHEYIRELVLKTLDHAVLEAVLHMLPEEYHETFLEKCEREYHEEALLDWLELHHAGIRPHLELVIRQTQVDIREIISLEQAP